MLGLGLAKTRGIEMRGAMKVENFMLADGAKVRWRFSDALERVVRRVEPVVEPERVLE